jgi:hypothetical protein
MLCFGALCSPWYLVGSVLLICLVFYVVLWCFMFTVVFGGVRVAQLLSFLCCALVIYVHRGILWSVLLIWFVFYVVLWCFMFTVVFGGVRVAHLFSFLCCALVLYVHRGEQHGPHQIPRRT